MDNLISSESNRLKQLAGQQLDDQLEVKFKELVDENVILEFKKNVNIKHRGYSYPRQYLANFVIQTIDNKFIIISSSTSYRQDRYKLQQYNIRGVQENANFAKDIIASIILYPDNQITASGFGMLRRDLESGATFSSATHTLLLTDLLIFIENHKEEVERERAEDATFIASNTPEQLAFLPSIKPNKVDSSATEMGSISGRAGNKLEKIITAILNTKEFLFQFQGNNEQSDNETFNLILHTLILHHSINYTEIIEVSASDSIKKLRSGGNAKTDISVTIKTASRTVVETISAKNTGQVSVSCHDYNAKDFSRVLKCEGSRLAKYFELFQEGGSHRGMESLLPDGFSKKEFEVLLTLRAKILTEWATKGQHDSHNLISPETQVSNFLFINHTKKQAVRFVSYDSYIGELFQNKKKSYGVPLTWTRSSKDRIQFKLPIMM